MHCCKHCITYNYQFIYLYVCTYFQKNWKSYHLYKDPVPTAQFVPRDECPSPRPRLPRPHNCTIYNQFSLVLSDLWNDTVQLSSFWKKLCIVPYWCIEGITNCRMAIVRTWLASLVPIISLTSPHGLPCHPSKALCHKGSTHL